MNEPYDTFNWAHGIKKYGFIFISFSSFIPNKKFLFLQHMNVLVIDVMVKEYWEVDESGTITDNYMT